MATTANGTKKELDRLDKLILTRFNQIKKDTFDGDEDDFFKLCKDAGIKDPLTYLKKLVQENPRYQFKKIEEVEEFINFFGLEFFDDQIIYDLGGTKIFTKLIKQTLSGKYQKDENGNYDGPSYFHPNDLIDTYIDWKFKTFEYSAWDNMWKTFEKLPKLKLYPTIILHDKDLINWETNYNSKISWILDETYSNEKVYLDMKMDLLKMAKSQNLNIFLKNGNETHFVKPSDSIYFINSSEYKLIDKMNDPED